MLEHIFVEFIKYVKFKARHNYIGMNTLKAFIAILLISGYVDLRRRTMFWENTADVQNIVVPSLIQFYHRS